MNYGRSRGRTLFRFCIPLYAWKLLIYGRNFAYREGASKSTSLFWGSRDTTVVKLILFLYIWYDLSLFVKHYTRILTIHNLSDNLSVSCVLYIRQSFIVMIRKLGLIPLVIFTERSYLPLFTWGDIHD